MRQSPVLRNAADWGHQRVAVVRQANGPASYWWQAPKRMSARQLARRLAPSIGLVAGPAMHVDRVYLDTLDWRLFRSGQVLVDETGAARTLVLQSRTTARSDLVVRASSRPRVASDLPGGLRDRLAPVLEPRRLLEVGRERAEVWPLRMIDADGKTIARVDVEHVQCDDAGTIVRVQLRPVRGYDRITRQMRAAFDAQADLSAADDPVVFAARALGTEPGVEQGPGPLRLDRAGRSVDALAAVLKHQLDTLVASESGVRQQLDPELLHEFRIAVRRTRSIVRLARSHLSDDLAKIWESEWEWLATITSTPRDLDVLLEELASARIHLPAESKRGLDELDELIRAQRGSAQTTLVAALDGDRYGTLKRGWRVGISELVATHHDATTTAELADELVARATRQLLRRAEAMTVDAPVESVHDVRKRTKRLRYTLDLLESALDRRSARVYLRATKRLQDDLGAFQDNVVYHSRMAELIVDSSSLTADALLVAQELMAGFDSRIAAARRALPTQIRRFVDEMSVAAERRP